MTLNVLSAAAKMNLRSVRAEIAAAFEEGLISERDYSILVRAHGLLTDLIEDACDVGRAGRPDEGPDGSSQSSGLSGSRKAGVGAPVLSRPRSPDAATLQVGDDPDVA